MAERDAGASAMRSLSPYAMSMRVSYGGAGAPGMGADWFGPLKPMTPIAPPQVAGRAWDFPPGYNLSQTARAYEPIGFGMLRALAESYDLLRLVLETRKDQLCRLGWSIHPKGFDAKRKSSKIKDADQAKIDELTKFWKRPDGQNTWRSWLRTGLEDLWVLDAPAIWCERNRGGKLLSLQWIDGATIKVVIDDWGRTPQPYKEGAATVYPVAYQEQLKGFSAVDYTTRDLLYRPYNRRSNKVYGYGPVEQIIITVNIALRRQMFQLSYYTEGNVPESLIGTPESWTPDQISAFQQNWDAMLTGNLAQRRHAKFVPGGIAKTFIQTKEVDLTGKTDEWLARVVCFCFSTSPQPFVSMMNRATAETAGDSAKEEGVEPAKQWVKEIVDEVNEREFGAEGLEFTWAEEVEVDQEKQTNILMKRVEDGAITLNEARIELGQDPFENPAANQLMVKTTNGYVPIEALTIEGKKQSIAEFGDPNNPEGGANGGDEPAQGDGKGAKGDGADGKSKPGKQPPKVAKVHDHFHGTDRLTKAARRARRLASIPFDRAVTRAAVKSIKAVVLKAFRKLAKQTADVVRNELEKVAKAEKSNEQLAQEIADAIDLAVLESVVGDVGDELAGVAVDAAKRALAQLGVTAEKDLTNQVNEAAVDMARQMAAEMVGKRYNTEGDLVDSVRAEYRIDESTRNMIRDTIAEGLDENIGTDEIAANIMESTGFSEERADLIANTEVRRANSEAALEGYKVGRDEAGVNVRKEWLLGENPCPICEANADEGEIDLDDEFSSGDDAPPAHPNCECALAPVVDDEAAVTEEAA